MTLGPREVMRSERVDGLTGPAHPIPNESLDCGCAQMRFPKLVKFATRKFLIGLLCWIGFIQAAAHIYYLLSRPMVARRFQIDPNVFEWLSLIADGFLPFLIAIPVAYWGDRIHRAAWTGALVLIQSVAFLTLIIPHFTHPSTRIIEETSNITHLSLYAEDNPELCAQSGSARILIVEEKTCYITLGIIILALIANCMGNIGFFTLGISYLDDNTKNRSIAFPISVILGVRISGISFGYLLAWGCFRLDAADLTQRIETYREQVGAWWLGWIILAILLAIPGIPMSWLPRRLPSEVIEQAAASIVDGIGRTSPLTESSISNETQKVGDAGYLPSLQRLLKNKILLFNIFASVFCLAALINYANHEDIILESIFYISRPSGLLLGFGDPITSRIVTTFLRPIIMGSVIILSGFIIIKYRPRPQWLVGYNIVVLVIATVIILSLAFLSCEKASIIGSTRVRSLPLLEYCNRNCRCSREAYFNPVCDSSKSRNFYTPCHAGCTGIDNSGSVKKFTGCSCIKDLLALTDTSATEGPCDSITCQIGWIVFQVSAIIVYSLVSSTAVSSLLIGLRSIYIQDKAIAIGFWITLFALFTYIPGSMLYWLITDKTCIHRAIPSFTCRLHDSNTVGAYLAFFTILLLTIAIVFEVLLFMFSRKLKIYRDFEMNRYDTIERPGQNVPLMLCPLPALEQHNEEPESTHEHITEASSVRNNNSNIRNEDEIVPASDHFETPKDLSKANGPLKYGPLGPGNPRITMQDLEEVKLRHVTDSEDTEDEPIHDRKAPLSLTTVQYKRLELDSDAETSDSSYESRRKIKSLQQSAFELRRAPDTDEKFGSSENTIAGFSKTDDIEFTKWQNKSDKEKRYTGDFNEVGIPIVNYALTSNNARSTGSILNPPQLLNEPNKFKMEKSDPSLKEEIREVSRGFSPVEPVSSGFGSYASDLHKISADSSAHTPLPETSENETSSEKSSSTSRAKPIKPSYSTAL